MSGAWNAEKVAAFEASFYHFLDCITINSKETGGNTVLGGRIYRAQKIFLDAVFAALSDDIHDIYVLKSRQLGLSTISRALTLFWLGVHEGLQGAMVFDTTFNTGRARREIVGMIEGLPKKLDFPRIKEDNRDGLILDNKSQLLFMTAGVKNNRTGGGLGRSVGLNMSHSSEVSSWANEEGFVSFRQALSQTYPDRLFIWESTARGYNTWSTLWKEALEDDLGKRTVFIGWWGRDDQEIPRGSPEFKKYGTEPPNRREMDRIRSVKEKYDWDITPEQLAWYRKTTDPTQDLDEDDPEDSYLLAEQPWDENEAFQQTGSSFFLAEKLTQESIRINHEKKPQAFKFWPGENFVSCDIRTVRYQRETEYRMWEEPALDGYYVVAGDPAFGHDEKNNNSAVQVLRGYADCIEQVGEYASATIQPHQFSWLLWTLVGYYGSRPGSSVLMICELNGPGEEVWRQYQSTRQIVGNGYLRKAAQEKGIANIFDNARNYIFGRSDSMHPGTSWMWKTNQQNKVQIMEAERNYLHNGTFVVHSSLLVEEMKSISRAGDTIGAEGGNRDDRVFSAALGIRGWDEKLRRGLISGNRTREAERAKLSLSITDQWSLFQRNQLMNFFTAKQAARTGQQRQVQRAAWRAGVGVRRTPMGRRY